MICLVNLYFKTTAWIPSSDGRPGFSTSQVPEAEYDPVTGLITFELQGHKRVKHISDMAQCDGVKVATQAEFLAAPPAQKSRKVIR
jgi:hypothetical protein